MRKKANRDKDITSHRDIVGPRRVPLTRMPTALAPSIVTTSCLAPLLLWPLYPMCCREARAKCSRREATLFTSLLRSTASKGDDAPLITHHCITSYARNGNLVVILARSSETQAYQARNDQGTTPSVFPSYHLLRP